MYRIYFSGALKFNTSGVDCTMKHINGEGPQISTLLGTHGH